MTGDRLDCHRHLHRRRRRRSEGSRSKKPPRNGTTPLPRTTRTTQLGLAFLAVAVPPPRGAGRGSAGFFASAGTVLPGDVPPDVGTGRILEVVRAERRAVVEAVEATEHPDRTSDELDELAAPTNNVLKEEDDDEEDAEMEVKAESNPWAVGRPGRGSRGKTKKIPATKTPARITSPRPSWPPTRDYLLPNQYDSDLSSPHAHAPPSPPGECGLYLDPSTLKRAGLGLFAGHVVPRGRSVNDCLSGTFKGCDDELDPPMWTDLFVVPVRDECKSHPHRGQRRFPSWIGCVWPSEPSALSDLEDRTQHPSVSEEFWDFDPGLDAAAGLKFVTFDPTPEMLDRRRRRVRLDGAHGSMEDERVRSRRRELGEPRSAADERERRVES
ncbi:hypothetical protein ACHAWF_009504 [Thalassiosira exigua]